MKIVITLKNSMNNLKKISKINRQSMRMYFMVKICKRLIYKRNFSLWKSILISLKVSWLKHKSWINNQSLICKRSFKVSIIIRVLLIRLVRLRLQEKLRIQSHKDELSRIYRMPMLMPSMLIETLKDKFQVLPQTLNTNMIF